MNGVKAIQRMGQGIILMELEGVRRLELDIYADHLEARTVVSHAGTTSPTEQIKKTRLAHEGLTLSRRQRTIGGHDSRPTGTREPQRT
jgi:hypothetical protein